MAFPLARVNRSLKLLAVGSAIRMLGNAFYAPFLALFLVNVLGVSYVGVGAIIAGVGLVQLPFNYLGGLFTDRIDRRRMILIGLTAEAVSTGLLAFGFELRSLEIAVAAALLGGTITSIAGPATPAYIADFSEGSERTRGFTLYRIGFNAGFSAGVTLGGLLVGPLGFAGVVLLGAGVVAAGTVFLAVFLEPSPRDVARREGRSHPNVEVAGARVGPPARSMRSSFGLLARDRTALELLVAVACASLVAGQWGVTFPLYVRNFLGVPYNLLGAGLALNGLVVVFGQSATTESVIGRRHTSIAIAGIGLYVLAFLGLGLAGLAAAWAVGIFFVATVVLTLGENLITIPQATLPSNIAPDGEIGSYNGAFNMVGGFGFLGSVVLGGFVLSAISNPVAIWLVLIVPAVPAMVLFRHAAGRMRPEVDRA